MKQHITPKQLNELSEKGKKRLRRWWKPRDGDIFRFGGEELKWEAIVCDDTRKMCDWEKKITNEEYENEPIYPLLSIGQMVEFLSEKKEEEHLLITDGLDYFFQEVDIGGKKSKKWKIQVASTDDYIGKAGISANGFVIIKKQFCDALWKAVKEKLEK